MCDHMIFLCNRQGNFEMAEYYRKEKEKMNRRQERGFPFFAILLILGFLSAIILSVTGG